MMRYDGTTTIAGWGPLAYEPHDREHGAELLTCERAHVPILWRYWDSQRCPLCGDVGVDYRHICLAVDDAVAAKEDALAEVAGIQADYDALRDELKAESEAAKTAAPSRRSMPI